MRRLRYHVASSLDGFIAGPHGEYDWIASDPSFDFAALWNQFDTLLMGRRTYEVALTRFNPIEKLGKQVIVASTTLDPAQHPGATILRSEVPHAVAALKRRSRPTPDPGKDIWLMGGGVLFRTLLDAGLVDTVELTIIPILLGSGVPMLPEGLRHLLHLVEHRPYPNGTISLIYATVPQSVSSAKSPRTQKRRKP
jgi:dihydrofolate reductase